MRARRGLPAQSTTAHKSPAAALFAAMAAALVLSACASQPAPSALPAQDSPAAGLLFIAHGYNNSADEWPGRHIKRLRREGVSTEGWDLRAHDWEEAASSVLTGARDGYAIGRRIGRELAGSSYRVIHLVGHSMGAHLIQGVIDSYRETGGEAYVQMTFIDPFSPRGLFSWNYGERNFGVGADYAESYIVTGDETVGTNGYLRHAHNYDITALVPAKYWQESGDAHWWPVRFYRNSVGKPGPGFSASPMVRFDTPPDPPHIGAVLRQNGRLFHGTVTVLD